MPKFSVITVNFNNKDGLERTIQSTLNQTYNDYEYIVVDGGSTDGSREIIEKYKEQFDWWCSEPDGGIYPAMNKGVRHANGDYCIFMNSGDAFYDKNVLADASRETKDNDIISGRAISNDGKFINEINHKDIFEQIMLSSLPHQATFIKKRLLEVHPYDESLKIASDWKFWLETILLERKSFFIWKRIVAKQETMGKSSNREQSIKERLTTSVLILSKFDSKGQKKITWCNSQFLVGEMLEAVRHNDKFHFKKYHSLFKKYPQNILIKALGIPHYLLYVCFPSKFLLRLLIKTAAH